MRKRPAALLLLLLLLPGCAARTAEPEPAPEPAAYTQITQEEAAGILDSEEGFILLDVRTREEYDSGHIPGAVCLPNEEIGTERPEILPDLGQTILVYCRTGRRSKEAAQKLADIGYANVLEFGGITTWTGDVTTD